MIWRTEKPKADEEEQLLPLRTFSALNFFSSRCWRRPREAGKLIHLVVEQIALSYSEGWEEIAPGRFNPTHCPGEHQSKKPVSSICIMLLKRKTVKD